MDIVSVHWQLATGHTVMKIGHLLASLEVDNRISFAQKIIDLIFTLALNSLALLCQLFLSFYLCFLRRCTNSIGEFFQVTSSTQQSNYKKKLKIQPFLIVTGSQSTFFEFLACC